MTMHLDSPDGLIIQLLHIKAVTEQIKSSMKDIFHVLIL